MQRTEFGIERLDELVRGVEPGESVVWQIGGSIRSTFVRALMKTLPARRLRLGSRTDVVGAISELLDRADSPTVVADLTGIECEPAAADADSDPGQLLITLVEKVFLSESSAHLLVRDDQFGAVAVNYASCVISVTPNGLRIDRADGRPPTVVGLQLTYEVTDSGRIIAQTASAASLLGRGLRALRRQRNWSQADLGQLIGVSGSAIGQAERGVHALSLESVLEISERTGLSIDQLIRENTPAPFEVTRAEVDPHAKATTLFSDARRNIEVITSQLAPRASTTPQLAGTHRAVIVLVGSGRVVAMMPQARAFLRYGDALRLDGATRISVRNIGTEPALVFWMLFS